MRDGTLSEVRSAIGAERTYRRTVLALTGLAALLAVYPLLRLFFDFEIDNTEGWNAYHQLRALAGLPLYQGGSPYFFNNYPPLSFYLVAALSPLTGDVNFAGRVLSAAALFALCLAARSIVRSAGGSRIDGLLAATTCALLFLGLLPDHVGKNNPQLPAEACVLWGLAVHLREGNDLRRGALSALLFSAGLLIKHNLIVLPLIVAVDLLRNGGRRAQLGYFITGPGIAVLSGAWLWSAGDGAFFRQLLASRTWDITRAFLFTTETLVQFQAPLAAAAIGLFAARRLRPSGLILGSMLGATALGAVFLGGAGCDVNVLFGTVIAASVAVGLTAHRSAPPRVRPALALIACSGALLMVPQNLGRLGVEALGEMSEREAAFRRDVEYLRGIEGTALCQSHLLCLRAGRPAFYDPINMLQAVTLGRLPEDTVTGMLRRHEIAVVEIFDVPRRAEDDNPGALEAPPRWKDFQDEVFQVLREEYVIDRIGVSGRFYRPKAG